MTKQNLDPALDTLPYLYTLHAQLQITLQKTTKGIPPTLLPGGGLFERLSVFLRSFDPIEVRYAGHQWRFAMEVLADIAQQDRSGRVSVVYAVMSHELTSRRRPCSSTSC